MNTPLEKLEEFVNDKISTLEKSIHFNSAHHYSLIEIRNKLQSLKQEEEKMVNEAYEDGCDDGYYTTPDLDNCLKNYYQSKFGKK